MKGVFRNTGKNVDLLDTSQIIPNSKIDNEITESEVVIYE